MMKKNPSWYIIEEQSVGLEKTGCIIGEYTRDEINW